MNIWTYIKQEAHDGPSTSHMVALNALLKFCHKWKFGLLYNPNHLPAGLVLQIALSTGSENTGVRLDLSPPIGLGPLLSIISDCRPGGLSSSWWDIVGSIGGVIIGLVPAAGEYVLWGCIPIGIWPGAVCSRPVIGLIDCCCMPGEELAYIIWRIISELSAPTERWFSPLPGAYCCLYSLGDICCLLPIVPMFLGECWFSEASLWGMLNSEALGLRELDISGRVIGWSRVVYWLEYWFCRGFINPAMLAATEWDGTFPLGLWVELENSVWTLELMEWLLSGEVSCSALGRDPGARLKSSLIDPEVCNTRCCEYWLSCGETAVGLNPGAFMGSGCCWPMLVGYTTIEGPEDMLCGCWLGGWMGLLMWLSMNGE